MNDVPKEQLMPFLPILKCSYVQIHFIGNVKKVEDGTEQGRILIVSNAGFLLFRKRTFPAGYNIVHHFQPRDLTEMAYDGNILKLTFTKNKTLELSHNRIMPLAAIIYQWHNSQRRHLTIENQQLSSYITRNVIKTKDSLSVVSRFISNCATEVTEQLLDQFTETCKHLSASNDTITIDTEILASPYLKQLISTVSRERSIKKLILKGLSLGTFQPSLRQILAHSKSIDSLIFVDFLFAGGSETDLLGEYVVAPIHKLSFIKCELGHPEFKFFINDMTKFKGSISSLTIENCKFTDQTLDSLFTSFFEAPCFYQLAEFTIRNVLMGDAIQQYIIQLLGSGWSLENKTLRKLNVENCQIQPSFFFPMIFLFETGIERITLRQMDFSLPFDNPIVSFFTLKTLDLSRARFTLDSFKSLFNNLSTAESHPNKLIFDKLQTNNASEIYKYLATSPFTDIEVLSWNSNKISKSDCANFFAFLSNCKKLQQLSINFSFDSSCTDEVSKFIENCQIAKLSLRGDSDNQVGIEQLLPVISKKKCITSLDIKGQKMSANGYAILRDMIKSENLTELRFDRCGGDATALFDTLQVAVQTPTRVEWPADDIANVIAACPSLQKDADNLKLQFTKRGSRLRSTTLRRNNSALDDIVAAESEEIPVVETEHTEAVMSQMPYDQIQLQESELRDLLVEVCGNHEDILLQKLKSIRMETAIDQFNNSYAGK